MLLEAGDRAFVPITEPAGFKGCSDMTKAGYVVGESGVRCSIVL